MTTIDDVCFVFISSNCEHGKFEGRASAESVSSSLLGVHVQPRAQEVQHEDSTRLDLAEIILLLQYSSTVALVVQYKYYTVQYY